MACAPKMRQKPVPDIFSLNLLHMLVSNRTQGLVIEGLSAHACARIDSLVSSIMLRPFNGEAGSEVGLLPADHRMHRII